jgi:hypothetical protein
VLKALLFSRVDLSENLVKESEKFICITARRENPPPKNK